MKIKPLAWHKRDTWVAESPFAHAGLYLIFFEDEKYYGPMTVSMSGFETLAEAKAACQVHHDEHVADLVEEEEKDFSSLCRAAMLSAGIAPDDFTNDLKALLTGDGVMWRVPVVNSFDESDTVDLEICAPTLEAAAVMAEAHATKHAEMYFDVGARPDFQANRREIQRIDGNGDDMKPLYETVEQQADKTWAIFCEGGFVKGGFKHQYQAEVDISNRAAEWEKAHGLRPEEEEID